MVWKERRVARLWEASPACKISTEAGPFLTLPGQATLCWPYGFPVKAPTASLALPLPMPSDPGFSSLPTQVLPFCSHSIALVLVLKEIPCLQASSTSCLHGRGHGLDRLPES